VDQGEWIVGLPFFRFVIAVAIKRKHTVMMAAQSKARQWTDHRGSGLAPRRGWKVKINSCGGEPRFASW
jgi:hypothetical protein